jgi:phage terminase small subunit
MGRPPKSPELRALHGDTRQRGKRASRKKVFLTAGAMAPEHEAYPPPEFLSARAKEIWRAEIESVTKRTMLKATDHVTFGLYCNALARYERLNAVLEAEGETYPVNSKHGNYFRARPENAQRDKAEAVLIKLSIELNLTTKSWIQSTATATARQLSLFAPREAVEAPTPDGKPADPDDPGSLDDYLASRPTSH